MPWKPAEADSAIEEENTGPRQSGAPTDTMSDGITISTFEPFPDPESARLYLESRRWPDGPRCPVCASGERIGVRKDGYYRCYACQLDFTVRVDTVMERSPIPLDAWCRAMVLVGTDPEIGAGELAAELGVTHKTASLVRARIHEAAQDLFLSRLDEPGYRSVPGYEHAYRVGRDGSLWTRYLRGRRGRIGLAWRELHPDRDYQGYRRASLCHHGRARPQKIAALVCAAFHGPRPTGQVCRHRDGDPGDDRAANLHWGTPMENVKKDARRHRTNPAGTRNPNARLRDSEIQEIRALRGKETQFAIATRYGISQGHVSRIQRGERRADS